MYVLEGAGGGGGVQIQKYKLIKTGKSLVELIPQKWELDVESRF